EAGVEDVRTHQDLGLARWWNLRGGPVDGPDVVTALRGEIDHMGADSAGGSEYGDVHGQVTPLVGAAAVQGARWRPRSSWLRLLGCIPGRAGRRPNVSQPKRPRPLLAGGSE